MDKLLAMHVAAQLTQAACGNVGGNLAVDPNLADNGVRAKNLHVWETFRVFYRGVAGALADAAAWPAPKMDATPLAGNLLQGLAPLLERGPLAELLKKLLAAIPVPAAIPAPVPAPPGPLPDPGAPRP